MFALRTVEGAELPRFLWANAAGRWTPLADTLVFSTTGEVQQITAFEPGAPGAARATQVRHVQYLEYRRQGSEVVVGHRGPCRDTLICEAPAEGVLTAGGMQLTSRRFARDAAAPLQAVYDQQ